MPNIAVTQTSTEISNNTEYKGFPNGQLFTRKAVISVPTGSLVLNAVIKAISLNAGETLHGVQVVATDMDGHSTPTLTLDVGYNNDHAASTPATTATSNAIIDGSAIGKTGGVAVASCFSSDDDGGTAFSAGPLHVTTDTTIDVHVQVAAATAAAGTLTVTAYIS
jgi:hypothetical protein